MRFGSVCSGIEAASVAWEPLGWKADWLAEIEPFPSAVLAHHYPETPNLGDMTAIARSVLSGDVSAPDVLTGGTPCQAFSVAGMREGLSDPRGELTIKFVGLADAIDYVREKRNESPSIVIWENVPGVLSDKGNAFGCFLGALAGEDCELQPSGKKWPDAGCVYGPKRTIAWRVLDAQYFGLAQRRRRVFVVASAREGFDPASVLFERDGVRRDSAPRRVEIKAVAALTANGVGVCGADGSEDGTGRGQPIVAFTQNSRSEVRHIGGDGQIVGALAAEAGAQQQNYLAKGSSVRRLMPVECERLQGFPDDYTLIPWRGKPAPECPDGPRYKAIGNSWAVPVARWVALRIIKHLEQDYAHDH